MILATQMDFEFSSFDPFNPSDSFKPFAVIDSFEKAKDSSS